MSFREKHLWISIFSAVVVWGVYFRELIDRVLKGGLHDEKFVGAMGIAFAGAVFVVAVIEVALTLIATLTTPKAERNTRDEREIHASLKASHVALMVLIALLFCVCAGAYFAGLLDDNLVGGTLAFSVTGEMMVLLANVLLACLILTEMVRAGVTLMLLRALR
ncbi:hypothetical protein [Brevundimonas sp. NIBR11]|uniref:hypothetical protein n=1 Tax=Brevundimonas sp. NIBR11 TaxID=3015999 RepID=UPI0022F11047|nr:hypothetical protein [Brevundimonas sp. NIBR11]WGM32917.1 hypothetical protein KKHFBJBL_03173 [Brevundimonas sp. NIBR11]